MAGLQLKQAGNKVRTIYCLHGKLVLFTISRYEASLAFDLETCLWPPDEYKLYFLGSFLFLFFFQVFRLFYGPLCSPASWAGSLHCVWMNLTIEPENNVSGLKAVVEWRGTEEQSPGSVFWGFVNKIRPPSCDVPCGACKNMDCSSFDSPMLDVVCRITLNLRQKFDFLNFFSPFHLYSLCIIVALQRSFTLTAHS